ncbi:MAG: S53 family peptidase, partial [Acidimicrobiales bacterium]
MGKLKGSVLSALSAVTLLGAGLAWITMTPAGAASRASAARGPAAMVRLSGSAAPINGAKLVDLAPSSRRLRVDVTLKVPHPGALEHYIAAISKRSSPLFHHFLRRGEFGARFGPPLGEIAKVESVLKKEGLSVLGAGSDRLVVHLRGTVGAVDRAFHVTIGRYRISSGRVGYANADPPEVPASIASDVQAVIGLNDLHPMGSLLVRDAPVPGGRVATGFHGHAPDVAGPKPCTGATSTAVVGGSLTANQLGSYYAMTPLYGLGSFGQGVHVGIVELEPNLPSDIAAYQTCYGTHATVSYHVVDGGVGKGTGSGEAALDIEGVIGIAPRSTIDVYQGPDDEFYDIASTIVSSDVDKVISISWGDCELDSEPSQLAAEQSLFAEAAAQGQTVLAAAGDAGSTDCLGDPGTIYASSLSVDDPASQPYVLGVGGTSVATSSESVWNDSSYSDGAGGGGTSATWCMPSYQDQAGIPGLIGSRSHSDAADCPASTPYDRQVPDVSADADPATGYTIYYGGEWVTVGGTSAAAPLWAGAAALIDSSPFCADYGSGDPGVLPEGLYGVAATEAAYIYGHGRHEALYDVTKGNNDYTPSGYAGGLYPATAGYDMASGLGSPLLGGLTALGASSNFYPGLAALMCSYYATRLTSSAITSVSPDIGATTSPTSVTITGTGFLAIQGADELEVGSRQVTASCTS